MKNATWLAVLLFLVPALAGAQNGAFISSERNGLYQTEWWFGLDGEDEVVAAGPAVWVHGWEVLIFSPTLGTVDAGDTFEVECAFSGSRAEPLDADFFVVHPASSSDDTVRMVKGDACEWVRINKPTDTDDATTVRIFLVKRIG